MTTSQTPAPAPGERYPHALTRQVAALRAGSLLHVVNYHVTPPERGAELERQLAGYLRHFDAVLPEHLDAWCRTGRWPLRRPGFAACFFDAHREHLLAAEVCESLGIAGWFLPPTGFVDCPVDRQADFCEVHDLWLPPSPHPDGRIALTSEELARIGRHHVLGGHTATHAVPDEAATDDDAQRELVEPALRLEQLSGERPVLLAWRLGLPHDPGHPATRAAVAAGYRYLLSATAIQRIA
jgi:hypothetical protein